MLALLYTGKLNDDNKRRKLNATFKKKKKKKKNRSLTEMQVNIKKTEMFEEYLSINLVVNW